MPHSFHHGHYHLSRMSEMGKVFWCHSVGAIGVSLVMLFIPIFLLKIGYTFTDVLLYLLMQQVFSAIIQFPVAWLFRYFGANHLMVVGSIWQIVLMALFITLPEYHWPLWSLAVVWALNRTMYWAAFHLNFSQARAHKHAGKQIAGITALTMLAHTAAPAVGGVAATLFGIKWVYGAAGVFLILAVAPMLSGDDGQRYRLRWSWAETRLISRDLFANVCNGIICIAENNLWPLAVSLLVASYAGIGLLSSVIAVASILVTLYVGRRSERKGEQHYIKEGLAVYGLASAGRAFVQNASQVFGLNLLGGIGRSLYVAPFMSRYYSNSDGAHRLGYITVMETAFSVGTSVFLLGLLGLAAVLPPRDVLVISLAVVALVSIGVRRMR